MHQICGRVHSEFDVRRRPKHASPKVTMSLHDRTAISQNGVVSIQRESA